MTEIKGIAIDIDTFSEPIEEWEEIVRISKCIFITFNKEIEKKLNELYDCGVIYVNPFERYTVPSPKLHSEVLKLANIKTTELLYVSCDYDFIHKAMSYYSGAVWISNQIPSYVQLSNCPDMKCVSLKQFEDRLKRKKLEYAECAFDPFRNSDKMTLIRGTISCDGDNVRIVSLGRYYGQKTYNYQLHPFSAAILLNKSAGAAKGYFDKDFSALLSKTVKTILESFDYDGICSVPARPGGANRFENIMEYISKENKIEDYSDCLRCTKGYDSQKQFTQSEREENIKGVFQCTKQLKGERIILVDDIITTGATIRECIRTLKDSGSGEVLVLVMGINQTELVYRNNVHPGILCPNCRTQRKLFVNTHNSKREFFYSCRNCKESGGLDYLAAHEVIVNQINKEDEI